MIFWNKITVFWGGWGGGRGRKKGVAVSFVDSYGIQTI